MVTPIDGSLLVFGWDYKDWCGVLAISESGLEVQEVILDSKFFLTGSIEMLLVFGSHSGKVFGQRSSIPSWLLDPVNYGGDNRVSSLSVYLVKVGKVTEVLMLLDDLSVLDYDLLVHTLALFNDVHIGQFSLGLM